MYVRAGNYAGNPFSFGTCIKIDRYTSDEMPGYIAWMKRKHVFKLPNVKDCNQLTRTRATREVNLGFKKHVHPSHELLFWFFASVSHSPSSATISIFLLSNSLCKCSACASHWISPRHLSFHVHNSRTTRPFCRVALLNHFKTVVS